MSPLWYHQNQIQNIPLQPIPHSNPLLRALSSPQNPLNLLRRLNHLWPWDLLIKWSDLVQARKYYKCIIHPPCKWMPQVTFNCRWYRFLAVVFNFSFLKMAVFIRRIFIYIIIWNFESNNCFWFYFLYSEISLWFLRISSTAWERLD